LPIPSIFEQWGESYFRSLEKEVLQEVALKDNVVLATGGGLPAQEDNWQILRKYFLTIFLQVDFSRLYQRIKGDSHRPLLSQYSTAQELEKLYRERLVYYGRADVIIDGNRSEREIIEEILYHEKISGLWRKR
ncbi:MAG TPA: shikimate kinase, partial [Candidatus Atribacteria bacterium]|nr:shikimate kinase [Candidatus Atribacteria bacterium]